jgi:hypothetical protein
MQRERAYGCPMLSRAADAVAAQRFARLPSDECRYAYARDICVSYHRDRRFHAQRCRYFGVRAAASFACRHFHARRAHAHEHASRQLAQELPRIFFDA